jgi:hypothetical protein
MGLHIYNEKTGDYEVLFHWSRLGRLFDDEATK